MSASSGSSEGGPLAGRGRIGLALGSGAAKGWSHIGVIRRLEARGVEPQIICGTSMGAIVGAAYAAGQLDEFEAWAESLEWTSVVGLLDISMRGGLIKAQRLFEFFSDQLPEARIEDLPRPFAAVGTDLSTGQEVWMREGSLIDALRATIAVPGLITPGRWRRRWMVDGGLVNPVPVSLARALGADFVIAVDLNTTLLGRRLPAGEVEASHAPPEAAARDGIAAAIGDEPGRDVDSFSEAGGRADERAASEDDASSVPLADRLNSALREMAAEWRELFSSDEPQAPGMPSLYEVLANSINVMQMRIGRSRMAGDPPELLVTPRLHDYGLLDFDRSAEAISEGERALDAAWKTSFSAD